MASCAKEPPSPSAPETNIPPPLEPTFTVEKALVGTWSSNIEGNIMGIEIRSDSSCDIFVERALKPRSIRRCRFEPFQDSYSVFLYNEHGACNFSPDFEFRFDASAPLIYFNVGSRSSIMLSKVQPE